jgi:SAM-dependent methyltransferase
MRAMWDERYSEEGWAYGTEPNDFLAEVCERIPPGSVLCLGEGEGRNAVHLAGRGHAVTAVDASGVGLAKAAALATERGARITTVQADLSSFRIEPAHWQGIVSIWCHLPQPLRREVHGRCVAGLAPGGVLVLEAYTPDQLSHGTGGPPTVALLMTLAELREEFRGLRLEIGRELERDVCEGRYHDGRSAVVQILALKEGPR